MISCSACARTTLLTVPYREKSNCLYPLTHIHNRIYTNWVTVINQKSRERERGRAREWASERDQEHITYMGKVLSRSALSKQQSPPVNPKLNSMNRFPVVLLRCLPEPDCALGRRSTPRGNGSTAMRRSWIDFWHDQESGSPNDIAYLRVCVCECVCCHRCHYPH